MHKSNESKEIYPRVASTNAGWKNRKIRKSKRRSKREQKLISLKTHCELFFLYKLKRL